MARCKYCGQGAGLFRDVHPECEELHRVKEAERTALEAERNQKVDRVAGALVFAESAPPLDGVMPPLLDGASGGDRAIIWDGVVKWFDHLVHEAEFNAEAQQHIEATVSAVMDHYGFKGSDLPGGLWGSFVRICACGDLDRGIIPTRVAISGDLPFNLESGERVAWVFMGAEYLEDKVVRSSTRGYAGVSMRVLPGLYTHMGAVSACEHCRGVLSRG